MKSGSFLCQKRREVFFVNRQISELLYSLFGALIFIGSVALYVARSNATTTSISQVKESYAKDNVYSEASLAITNEEMISRQELVAMLNNNPNKFVVIRDNNSGWSVRVHSGMGIDCTVEAANSSVLRDPSVNINFHKDGWDPRKLDLDTWLTASRYRVQDIVDKTGAVNYVLYYAERGW